MRNNLNKIDINERIDLLYSQIQEMIKLQGKHTFQYINKTKKDIIKEISKMKITIQ